MYLSNICFVAGLYKSWADLHLQPLSKIMEPPDEICVLVCSYTGVFTSWRAVALTVHKSCFLSCHFEIILVLCLFFCLYKCKQWNKKSSENGDSIIFTRGFSPLALPNVTRTVTLKPSNQHTELRLFGIGYFCAPICDHEFRLVKHDVGTGPQRLTSCPQNDSRRQASWHLQDCPKPPSIRCVLKLLHSRPLRVLLFIDFSQRVSHSLSFSLSLFLCARACVRCPRMSLWKETWMSVLRIQHGAY